MLRPDTFAFTAMLALLAGLSALNVDIYLPSMPPIAYALGASSADVQLTLSAFMIGGAIATITYGPVADRFGRRPVLLAALVIYCLGTLVCMLAPTIEVLVIGRIVQALGPAGTAVIARAMVRDLYEGARIGRELSVMSATMAFLPLVAPLIGGTLQTFLGWRAVFAFLLCVGLLALIFIWFKLAETLRVLPTTGISLGATLSSFAVLLTSPTYVAHVAIVSTGFIGMMAWLLGAPFALQETYGLTAFWFSVIFIIPTAFYLLGAALASRVVMRLGIDRTIGVGVAALATAGVAMVVAVASGVTSAAAMVVPMSLYLGGVGFVFPQGMAGAMAPFHTRAGAASSFAGFVQQLTGAIVGVVIAFTFGQSVLPLALTIAAGGVIALVLWVTTRRIRTAQAGMEL